MESYEEFINNILETRGRFNCGNEYHERHHIIPKCMGGIDSKDNLIDLFAREHYEAHRLLALENPEIKGLQIAWWNMCQCTQHGERKYNISAEEYEDARKRAAELMSGENSPMYGKRGELNHRYGVKLSEEHKKKIGDAQRGRKMPKELVIKNSESHKGIHPSDATKKKMSESHKGKYVGEKHNLARKIICVETGEILWGAKAFQEKYGFWATSITRCCKGKQKLAHGYHWRYADDIKTEQNDSGETE